MKAFPFQDIRKEMVKYDTLKSHVVSQNFAGRFYYPLLVWTVDSTEVSLKLDLLKFSFAIPHVDAMYNCNSVRSA
jgi:hypothetical protein